MYCETRDEYVDYDVCSKCEDRYGCRDKITDKVVSSEDKAQIDHSAIAQAMQERLSVLLGLQPENINAMVISIVKESERTLVREIENCVKEMVKAKVNDVIKESAGKYLNKAFKFAVNEQILCWNEKESALKLTIQEIVLNKIKGFLATKDRNKKVVIQQSVDEAIQSRVDEMVSTAIEEIKEETIDKFNKEIMKKMMCGMAKEIVVDKRLMAAIEL